MLDERKKHILRAIVDDYISTAEPIGSRTIAKKYSLGVSPATIRNEMADLEALGYITHLYASSGRIPSSKGYRFYVDDLLTLGQMSADEISLIEDRYATKVQSVEEVFKLTAQILSEMTKNVSLVLGPESMKTKFKCLRFILFNETQLVIVMMTNGGFIDNKLIDIPEGLTIGDFERIANLFNNYLFEYEFSEISLAILEKLQGMDINPEAFKVTVEALTEALHKEHKERLYLGGKLHLMEQPEFHDVDKIKRILSMLEQEQILCDILQEQRDSGVAITIGQENKYSEIKDCSIISATYMVNSKPLATLAVLGPTRMDYGKIISLLKYLNSNVSKLLTELQI